MSLYFETAVKFKEPNVISTNLAWHPTAPLLAIGSYSQDRGGFVTIFDETGESLHDVLFPVHPVSQVTAITWHPERNVIVCAWENGDMKVWNGSDTEFSSIAGPHRAPVILLDFSEKGGRLVSCDSSGTLVGWRVDGRAQTIMVFQQDLKESITHLTFRLTIRSQPEFDVEGLAKAAVNGDEHALDMFSNWRPKTTARKFRVQDGSDNLGFFVGTQAGSVYFINDAGICMEVLNTEGIPLGHILHHPNKNSLIVMMEGLTIGHFAINSKGQLTELIKIKLSGKGQSIRGVGSQGLTWANNSCLAILTGDLIVRIWDLDTNDNYTLPDKFKDLEKNDKIKSTTEMFSCVTYCKLNQTICAGTNTGRIYFWIKSQAKAELFENQEDSWELHNINSVDKTIKQMNWGSFNLRIPLLSVNCVTKVYIMKEQALCTSFSEKIWATQRTPTQILLETPNLNAILTADMQVSDMSVSSNNIAVTNGRVIAVYDIIWNIPSEKVSYNASFNSNKKVDKSTVTTQIVNSFRCDNEGIIIYESSIIILTLTGISKRAFNGAFEATIPTVPSEGEPIGMDIKGNILTIFTMDGFLKIFDLLEEEPKLLTTVRNLYDMCNDFGEIIQAKINCNGNIIALTLAASNLIPDGKLYIWDIEQDNFIYYDFRKYNTSKSNTFENFDNFENDVEDETNLTETQRIFNRICSNRIPLTVHWDNEDPRLFVVNAKKLKNSNLNANKGFMSLYGKNQDGSAAPTLEEEDHVVITIFVTKEHGIQLQDIRAINPDAKLLAVSTPYLLILKKLNVVRETMSNFNGIENCNKATKEAILEFSYHLSLGNMDAAFKAIKLITAVEVWNNLAVMCVKTRRLDVARVCLGHMGNARAARALRIATEDPSLPTEAKLAVLATQLNMLNEAEQFYIQCERYDLLNKFYQNCNKMDAALKIAETKDRIHLKNTEHVWAQVLEQSGNIKEAINHYEKAGTHFNEVPRMLMDHPTQLETYMSKTTEPELLRWWGQYTESLGELNGALKIYTKAGDVYNQVRTLCFMGEEHKAAQLAEENTDKAAFYHMARYYETTNNIKRAVDFFIKANAFGNAVRLCKENHMSEELWKIGLHAGRREQMECAKYLEDIGANDKAIIMYHRSGMLHKALDLAFKYEQFDILQQIATSLDTDSDPALIEKCADYFITNQQFDKAVDLLAVGKKYKEAIDLCLNHNVQVTEDLAEKLTPEKDKVDEETKNNILETLAESLMLQGNYHLATKKFTQAGDRMRAMKALLKSGDTDKIIFFAGVSRQREIYIMAANYLQSLDWQNQPEILRNIITFYSKGKALDLLANFYVACAQIEIDEFQNYEKAYGALTEASRCLSKISSPASVIQHQKAIELVQKRMTAIKRFIDIRRLFERGDTDAGVTQCKQFLISGGVDLEESVRRGDIYALMIQQYIKTEQYLEAKQLVGELRQVLSSGNVPITYYLNKELIEDLAQGLGIAPSSLVPTTKANLNVKDDIPPDGEIEEEVEE